jgi:hypothetical protein
LIKSRKIDNSVTNNETINDFNEINADIEVAEMEDEAAAEAGDEVVEEVTEEIHIPTAQVRDEKKKNLFSCTAYILNIY